MSITLKQLEAQEAAESRMISTGIHWPQASQSQDAVWSEIWTCLLAKPKGLTHQESLEYEAKLCDRLRSEGKM